MLYCPACEAFFNAELRGKSCPACGEELIKGRFPANGFPNRPKKKTGPTVGRAAWDHIIKKDICSLCQKEMSTTIEHIEPKALGGSKGAWTNRAGACRECNNKKKHTPLLFFMLQENKGVDLSDIIDEEGNWPINEDTMITCLEKADDHYIKKKEATPKHEPRAHIYAEAYQNPHRKIRDRDPDHEGGRGGEGKFCSKTCPALAHRS